MRVAPQRRRPVWVLFWALALILATTLFPYQFGAGFPARTLSSVPERPVAIVQDVVANILLFWPLGVALAGMARRRCLPPLVGGLLPLVGSMFLSLGVEGLQQFLPSRDPSLRDVATNTLGGGLGGLCLLAWQRQLSAAWRRIAEASGFLCCVRRPVLALCAYLPFLFVTAGVLQTAARLSNWDGDFPLIVGNEATGDRPWSGRLQLLEVAGRALRSGEARAALDLPLDRLFRDSIVLSHQFAEGELEGSGIRAHFEWKGPGASSAPERSGLGIALSPDRWLESRAAGREISQRLRGTNHLTLRLVCLPATLQQAGPARIFSISTDPYHRNLTLGQEERSLIVRLRTPITGPNGREPELVVPNAFAPGLVRTILVTYDGAVLTVFTDGTESSYGLDLSPGAILALMLVSPNSLDLPGYNLLFTGLALVPVGFLLAVTARRRSSYRLVQVLTIVVPSLLCAGALEGILIAISGRFVQPHHVAAGTAFCLAGAAFGWRLLSRKVPPILPGP